MKYIILCTVRAMMYMAQLQRKVENELSERNYKYCNILFFFGFVFMACFVVVFVNTEF